jgi:hypothetical protein
VFGQFLDLLHSLSFHFLESSDFCVDSTLLSHSYFNEGLDHWVLHSSTLDRISSSRMSRKLQALCDDGTKPAIHYFEVVIRIQPDTLVTGICTLADQMKLGSDINKILSSHVSYHFIWNVGTFI